MKYTLENVEIENPCPIKWDSMSGNDEVRHCHTCRHKVYNISEMPKRRALKVLNQKEDSVCILYYRDDRNRIVTQNYFGVFKRSFVRVCGAILAVIFSFNSLYAIQTKTSTSKKKKVVKHRKYKKPVKPPMPLPGKRVLSKKNVHRKPVIGLLQ